jgi:hypothetical protein
VKKEKKMRESLSATTTTTITTKIRVLNYVQYSPADFSILRSENYVDYEPAPGRAALQASRLALEFFRMTWIKTQGQQPRHWNYNLTLKSTKFFKNTNRACNSEAVQQQHHGKKY